MNETRFGLFGDSQLPSSFGEFPLDPDSLMIFAGTSSTALVEDVCASLGPAFPRAGRSTSPPCSPRPANDCEPVVCLRHPVVNELVEWLRQRVEREDWARMTGTGSAAFGVFRGEESAWRAMRGLPESWDGWVARGIAESPLRRAGLHGPASGSSAGEEPG